MRNILLILLLFVNASAFAVQADSVKLVRSVTAFNKALLDKDTVALNDLLADKVHYHHSNGWKQTKRDIIEDLYSGKLVYRRIDIREQKVRFVGEHVAQVRMNAFFDVDMEGKPVQLNLRIVQVWVYKNSHWELFSRHSKKI